MVVGLVFFFFGGGLLTMRVEVALTVLPELGPF